MADIYNIYKICGFCGGSGEENSSEGLVVCHACEGDGRWLFGIASEQDPQPEIETFDLNKTCGFCGGPGTIPPTNYTCPMCEGSGIYIWAVMEKQE